MDTTVIKHYIRLKLGNKSIYADQCFDKNFIGVDFDIAEDMTTKLREVWREFSKEYVPVYMKDHPEKSKLAAGLACGSLWTFAKYLMKDDMVLCPDSTGKYRIGKITSDYFYAPGQILPHRRSVQWENKFIDKSTMSDDLMSTTGWGGMLCDVSKYQAEIDKLISENPVIVSNDPNIEDPAAFVIEKHLEDFLVQNWALSELGKEFDIYTEEGELKGQQYPTDTGPLDILAVSKDNKRVLVVELKKGKASDVVVGQVLRYMGYVKEVLAENGQTVEGAIIALEDDQKIRRALAVVPSIKFFRYQINFKLIKS